MAYLNKAEAFEYIAFRYPRGADVGTKVYYIDPSTQQRVEFSVAAEQVWRTDTGERVMGLVWAGVCGVCREGFFQTSPTHPKELNERCAFCCSQRYDTHNVADIKVFNPNKIAKPDARGMKRRGRLEMLVLESLSQLEVDLGVDRDGNLVRGLPVEGVPFMDFVDAVAATLPPPEDGKRDIRRQSVVRACNSLMREEGAAICMKANGPAATGQFRIYSTK